LQACATETVPGAVGVGVGAVAARVAGVVIAAGCGANRIEAVAGRRSRVGACDAIARFFAPVAGGVVEPAEVELGEIALGSRIACAIEAILAVCRSCASCARGTGTSLCGVAEGPIGRLRSGGGGAVLGRGIEQAGDAVRGVVA
jgi:hypothetical protein